MPFAGRASLQHCAHVTKAAVAFYRTCTRCAWAVSQTGAVKVTAGDHAGHGPCVYTQRPPEGNGGAGQDRPAGSPPHAPPTEREWRDGAVLQLGRRVLRPQAPAGGRGRQWAAGKAAPPLAARGAGGQTAEGTWEQRKQTGRRPARSESMTPRAPPTERGRRCGQSRTLYRAGQQCRAGKASRPGRAAQWARAAIFFAQSLAGS